MQPKVDEVKSNSEKGFQKSRQTTGTNTNSLWQAAYSDFMPRPMLQTANQTTNQTNQIAALYQPFMHPPDFLDFSASPSIYAMASVSQLGH